MITRNVYRLLLCSVVLLAHELYAQPVTRTPKAFSDLDPATRRLLTQPPEMSWNIDPRTRTHVNQQTKVAFRGTVATFHLQNAVPAAFDGTATFTYGGKHGTVTVLFAPRAVVGCGGGQDCSVPALASQNSRLKRLHGKADSEQAFRLSGVGRGRGRGTAFRAVASPRMGGKPAFCEIGAVEIGEFMFCYGAAFKDEAGRMELANFLRSFGLKKT